VTFYTWDKFEPDHAPWSAVEQCPEHEDDICDKSHYDCRPGAKEHDSIGTTAWCEQLEILEKNGHLDQETEGTVDDLRGVCPLGNLVKMWS
jgi:hypothetical protein